MRVIEGILSIECDGLKVIISRYQILDKFESIYTFIIVKRFLKTSLEYQIQSFCDQMKVVKI